MGARNRTKSDKERLEKEVLRYNFRSFRLFRPPFSKATIDTSCSKYKN
jgi:hypothetical protein